MRELFNPAHSFPYLDLLNPPGYINCVASCTACCHICSCVDTLPSQVILWSPLIPSGRSRTQSRAQSLSVEVGHITKPCVEGSRQLQSARVSISQINTNADQASSITAGLHGEPALTVIAITMESDLSNTLVRALSRKIFSLWNKNNWFSYSTKMSILTKAMPNIVWFIV